MLRANGGLARREGFLSKLDPVGGSERLDVIDALRGFALAGVLFINAGAFSLYFYLDAEAKAQLPTAGFDIFARLFTEVFVDRKFITLFSLLFGFGFAIQLERAKQRGAAGLRLYARRTGVLLVFGVVHAALIWWGDILLMYALLALLLIPLRDLSARTLVGLGLFVALILPTLVAPLLDPLAGRLPGFDDMKAAALPLFSGASYADVVEGNVRFALWTYGGWWDDWFFIFGRFLLGYWAGRTLLFHRAEANRGLLKRMFVVAALAGLGATALKFWVPMLTASVPALESGLGAAGLQIVLRVGPLGMGIAYACGFALLFLAAPWRRWLERLAPVGRMALTNYLTHSIVGIVLFYGIGLGLGPDYGYVARILMWAALFGSQIAFSRWWLSRYRFGPAEWLWRSLTYRQRQPMRLDRTTPVEA